MSESIPRSFHCGSKFSTCWIHGIGKMESCRHITHKGRRVCDTPARGDGVGRFQLVLDQFLAGTDQRAEPLGQQGNVERLLEALVDVGPVHRDLRAVVR